MTSGMLFDSWTALARVLIVGTLAYVALIVLLRTSGKRTLSKLNAFDLVVTVALGSTLATVLLSKTVALAEGILALALLIGLQFVIAWLAVRWPDLEVAIKSEPTLLLRDGRFLDGALRRQRMTRSEVLSAVRGSGYTDTSQIAAVILETDGTISVMSMAGEKRQPGLAGDALSEVADFPGRARGRSQA